MNPQLLGHTCAIVAHELCHPLGATDKYDGVSVWPQGYVEPDREPRYPQRKAEIMALGKPSILVPYPHAAGHQEFNARKLLDVGGCRMVMDHELNGSGGNALVGHIRELVSSEDLRSEMRRHARALGRPDAAQKVVDLALSLVRARSGNV